MIKVGLPDAWERFENQHLRFLERFHNLQTAMNVPMLLNIPLPTPNDRVVLFLALACMEDFNEILLLCGNGYGLGALKLLRGMYERAVTAHYLHQVSEETDNFIDYYWIAQHKLTRAVQQVFGENVLPADQTSETEKRYRAVKERFKVTDCETCQTTRLNHTWSKLDFVSMAKMTGDLGKLIVSGYLLPTQEAHSTTRSMISRLENTGSGKFAFVSGQDQENEVKMALITGHNIVLSALSLIKDHFNLLALDAPLKQCVNDFFEIWNPDSSAETNPTSA